MMSAAHVGETVTVAMISINSRTRFISHAIARPAICLLGDSPALAEGHEKKELGRSRMNSQCRK
jgi:hypothetical protein